MAEPELKRRTAAIGIVVLLVILGLLGRMWQLQIVHGEEYAALADGNRLRRLATTAPRGKIYDRIGRVVADNRLVLTVSVVPGGLTEERDLVVERLGAILGMAPEEIEEALEGGRRAYPYEPIRVFRDVPPEVAVAIEENRMDLPGVILEQEPVRRYTAGQAMSHVLGYLLSASPEDLRMYSGYRPDDLVGKAGIERAYEEYLRGQHGFQQVEVNALSRAIRQLGSVPPVPGHDLVLTVDAALQQAVMDIITRRLEELAADPTARGRRAAPRWWCWTCAPGRSWPGQRAHLRQPPAFGGADRVLAAAAGGPPVAHVQPGCKATPAGLVLQARDAAAALGAA